MAVEKGAGLTASINDADYEAEGATVGTRADVLKDADIVLGDTMGEMMLLYGCADIAFVGGSLIERGGHNMIEPACWGLPIICGPHTFNFADISKRLESGGGMVTVTDMETLAAQLLLWLAHPQQRIAVGDKARAFAEQNRGAVDRLMQVIQPYLPPRQ